MTLRKDSDKKFDEDFSQRSGGEFEKYFFFTNQYLTADQKKKYVRFCLDSLNAVLIPQYVEALRSLLDSALKAIRESYLHIKNDAVGVKEEDLAALRDEIERKNTADTLLLKAYQFTTDLIEKKGLIEEAVSLWPLYRQKEYRQLGLEMSVAVVDGFDHVKYNYLKSADYTFEPLVSAIPLNKDEITFFMTNAISYLKETALAAEVSDAQGLLYLACMYGYAQQYNEMIKVLEKESQISAILQDMKNEFRCRQMILILLGACSLNQAQIERLRKTLNVSRITKVSFCEYINEFPLETAHLPGEFIEWIAVRKSETPRERERVVIKITPPYPSNQRKVDAFFVDRSGAPNTIVPVDKRVSVDALYTLLNSSFILFCHLS